MTRPKLHPKQLGFRRAIGARLRELRLAAGITSQESLAHSAGLHRTFVGRIERGESGVTLETLATILEAMSLPLSQFFETFTQPRAMRTPRKRE